MSETFSEKAVNWTADRQVFSPPSPPLCAWSVLLRKFKTQWPLFWCVVDEKSPYRAEYHTNGRLPTCCENEVNLFTTSDSSSMVHMLHLSHECTLDLFARRWTVMPRDPRFTKHYALGCRLKLRSWTSNEHHFVAEYGWFWRNRINVVFFFWGVVSIQFNISFETLPLNYQKKLFCIEVQYDSGYLKPANWFLWVAL